MMERWNGTTTPLDDEGKPWPASGSAAVVISGAGARGAYEAGALAELLPVLFPDGLGDTFLLGTSAGSVNATLWAGLASRGRSLWSVGEEVCKFWVENDVSKVYTPMLVNALKRTLRLDWLGHLNALLDTTPSKRSAGHTFRGPQIAQNIAEGSIRGVGVVATTCPLDATAGRSRVFYQGERLRMPENDGRAIDYVKTPLHPEHVLASSAIPTLFPPVFIDHPAPLAGWYCDGGVRLNAPIKPALALGAERLVVVSSNATTYPDAVPLPDEEPDIIDLTAQTMHVALADGMIEDLRRLRRINKQVDQGGGDGDGAGRRAHTYLPLVTASPVPGTLARMARRILSQPCSLSERYRRIEYEVMRRAIAGVGSGRGNDEMLSYLFFEPEYARQQIQLGRQDARAKLAGIRSTQERGLRELESAPVTMNA